MCPAPSVTSGLRLSFCGMRPGGLRGSRGCAAPRPVHPLRGVVSSQGRRACPPVVHGWGRDAPRALGGGWGTALGRGWVGGWILPCAAGKSSGLTFAPTTSAPPPLGEEKRQLGLLPGHVIGVAQGQGRREVPVLSRGPRRRKSGAGVVAVTGWWPGLLSVHVGSCDAGPGDTPVTLTVTASTSCTCAGPRDAAALGTPGDQRRQALAGLPCRPEWGLQVATGGTGGWRASGWHLRQVPPRTPRPGRPRGTRTSGSGPPTSLTRGLGAALSSAPRSG